MSIFLIKDYFRIDGMTGGCLESEFDFDFVRHEDAITLESARNQYISFQIVFVPESGRLENVLINCAGLKGDGVLEAENFSLFIEWFHRLEGRLIPDLLVPWGSKGLQFNIPLDTEYLPDQKAGAVWVDLFIPGDAVPGEYSGLIAVNADGLQKEFGISLFVHDAVVPAKSKITADLNNYADSISPAFPSLAGNASRYDDGSFFAMERQFHKLARDHRSLFHNLGYSHSGKVTPGFAPELEGEGKNIRVKSWERFDSHFGPLLDGSAFDSCKTGVHPLEFLYLPFNLGWPASYEKWGQKGYKTEYRRIIAEFVRHFEEKGWINTVVEILLNHKKDYRFFPYTADEIWYEHDEESVDLYYDVIKDTYSDTEVKIVFRMDSSNYWGTHSIGRFADMCGMWVAGVSMFNWFPESMAHMKAKGNIVWIYGPVLRGIGESLLSLFTWPIHCVMTGATGFTLWNTTGFGKDYLAMPLDEGTQAVMYPGCRFGHEGPLPSIRMKALRNYLQAADLAMTSVGTPRKRQVDELINKCFGVKDNSGWWREKPDFINTPPRYWDFEKAVDEASLAPMHLGRSPAIIEKICVELYELMSKRKKERANGQAAFKYQ